jgi:regulator of sigma E protease
VTFIWFVVLVGLLITVHELGHFVAARIAGVRVEKLSIGFGPALVSIRRRGTEYALSVIPLGGYVRLLGEDGADVSEAERPRSFALRPTWQRLAIILAGPLGNLLFAVVIFTQLYARETTARSATIGSVLAGQPAADADLRGGDVVVSVDGHGVDSWDELIARVSRAPGRELRITIVRAGAQLTKVITPRAHRRRDPLGGEHTVGLIGIAPHFRLAQVGVLHGDNPARAAGIETFDVVTSIQGRPVQSAADLEPLIAPRSGAAVLVGLLRPMPSPLGAASVTRLEPRTAQVIPASHLEHGRAHFETGLRPADLFVYDVESGTPASALGLVRGDLVVSLDGAQLGSFDAFAQALDERPDAEHRIRWRAADGEHEADFRLANRRQLDEYQSESTTRVFGARTARAILPVPSVPSHISLPVAVARAFGRSLSAVGTLVRAVGLTLVGDLPASSFGGPLLIYQAAGVAAEHGVQHFVAMAAVVSLNLGVLNLLPVPILDGGEAALVLVEAIGRRRVSPRVRKRAAWLGLGFLGLLLLLALRNDLGRLL